MFRYQTDQQGRIVLNGLDLDRYKAFSATEKAQIRGAFFWHRTIGKWVSKIDIKDAKKVARELRFSEQEGTINIPQSKLEQKQEKRKAPYEQLSEKASKRSDERYKAAKDESSVLPFGQPILVGHHSEKRHRALLNRIDNNMRKSFEEGEKSVYYQNKAESVGTAGISSDDPEAIAKLRKKLAGLEANHKDMLAGNRILRNKKLSKEEKKAKIREKFSHMTEREIDILLDWGFGTSNSSANIRRVKQRIAQLEKGEKRLVEAGGNNPEHTIGKTTVLENQTLNRVQILFPEKPDGETIQKLKQGGFRWSRKYKAWQGSLKAYYIRKAVRMAAAYEGLDEEAVFKQLQQKQKAVDSPKTSAEGKSITATKKEQQQAKEKLNEIEQYVKDFFLPYSLKPKFYSAAATKFEKVKDSWNERESMWMSIRIDEGEKGVFPEGHFDGIRIASQDIMRAGNWTLVVLKAEKAKGLSLRDALLRMIDERPFKPQKDEVRQIQQELKPEKTTAKKLEKKLISTEENSKKKATRKQHSEAERKAMKAKIKTIVKTETKGKKQLTPKQVLAIAQRINAERSLYSFFMDSMVDHDIRRLPTERNLKVWAKDPGGSDLIGVDNAKKSDPTVNVKRIGQTVKIKGKDFALVSSEKGISKAKAEKTAKAYEAAKLETQIVPQPENPEKKRVFVERVGDLSNKQIFGRFLPLGKIKTDEQRFQNRKSAFSQESVKQDRKQLRP
jgi:hypothetical protein